MEKYYKALTKEGFIVRLIKIEDSIGEYNAFDLISDNMPHLKSFVLDPKPNTGWLEISLNEYSNILLDTMSERKDYRLYDTELIPFARQKEMVN